MIDLALEIFNTYWFYWLSYTIGTWLAFFGLFGIVNKYKIRDKWYTKVAAGLFVTLLDWPCNIFLSGIPFFDLPAHPFELVTGRLKRYKRKMASAGLEYKISKLGWYRYDLAITICNQLNRADKRHC